MSFQNLFASKKPVIGCIHLLPLPGSPLYKGDREAIYRQALEEVALLESKGVDGLIVENFRDKPFYPERVPAETIAAMAALAREIVRTTKLPIGINVLRNDAESAIAIAAAVGAHFIRVNVLGGAVVSEQGLIVGKAHLTLRLREALKSQALIFADVGVKHAAPLADRGLATETIDASERTLADALIVSGSMTGKETDIADVDVVRANTTLPILIGSGATPENVSKVWPKVDGLIVGSTFKKEGQGNNALDPARIDAFMQKIDALRSKSF